MTKLQLKGYESLNIGGYLNLPDIFTLAMQPMFTNADFTIACENASPIIRDLLERVPLKGGYKYTKATSFVQFLSPETSSIENNEWHLDPGVVAPHLHDTRLHILCSGYDLTSTTKFIEEDMEIEKPDWFDGARHRMIRQYLTENAEAFGFKAISIPHNHFVTFTNLHPHIALPPKKYEMRYFLRVQESDIESPNATWEQSLRKHTSVLADPNSNRMETTFEQITNGLILKTGLGGF